MSVLPQWKVQSLQIPCELISSENKRIILGNAVISLPTTHFIEGMVWWNPQLAYLQDEDQAELCACLSSTSTRFWAQLQHRLESFLGGEGVLFSLTAGKWVKKHVHAHEQSKPRVVGTRRQSKGMNPQGLERFRRGAEGKSSLFSVVRWLLGLFTTCKKRTD